MKIAIINQESSIGGWNYLCLLAKALKKISPNIEITIFTKKIYNDDLTNFINDLKSFDIRIERFEKLNTEFVKKNIAKNKLVNSIFNKIRLLYFNTITKHKKSSILSEYNLLFYSWPFALTPIDINVPMFFIPHDFIVSHFFGSYLNNYVYKRETWLCLKTKMEQFFQKGTPIVSTPFIKDEIKRLFPKYADKTNVVYLSKLNDFNPPSINEIKMVLEKYDIKNEYILYANNAQLHKNMGQVISAYYYVKQKHPNIKLIITGFGTENIRCIVNSPYYADFIEDEGKYDIKSLGEIPYEDFSAILQGAKMVINASLCEAGSGSGLDAWSMGVPFVMSDIPAFKQQLDYLGTKAELFDPRNSSDIARAIIHLLDNPQIAKENAKISKEAMEKYTWEDVARQYLEIFEKGITISNATPIKNDYNKQLVQGGIK